MMNLLKVLSVCLLCSLAYLLFWPVPIEPSAWDAPENRGYVGAFAPNTKLSQPFKHGMGEMSGPEAAIEDAQGNIVATTHEGWLVYWRAGEDHATPIIDLGGRALGLDFDADGNLWIANAYLGIQKLTPEKKLTLELSEVDGKPLLYADDLAVAPDGKIYFSDASTRFSAKEAQGTLEASLLDILEHSDNGRIIEFDPASGVATTIMDELTFANGVAVDPSGRFALIAETGEYRVHKLWLQADKKGQSEVLIDNLPGFPDNVHLGQNGRFWIGLTSPRSKIVDDLADQPFLRKMVQRLPAFMRPNVVNYGLVFAINEAGEVVSNLQAPKGAVYATTGVAETDEFLYVTSLTAPYLARYSKAELGIE